MEETNNKQWLEQNGWILDKDGDDAKMSRQGRKQSVCGRKWVWNLGLITREVHKETALCKGLKDVWDLVYGFLNWLF
jgi:hypothetical protein